MAVKKNKGVTPEVDVNVQDAEVVEEKVENTAEVEVDATPEVEIEEPQDEVEVDTEKTEVDTSKKPNGTVRIKMRVDHRCCIAMERYDLKAGKTYVVPRNVKEILDKAGMLSPL